MGNDCNASVAFGTYIAVDEDGTVVSYCLTVAIADLSRREKTRMGMAMKETKQGIGFLTLRADCREKGRERVKRGGEFSAEVMCLVCLGGKECITCQARLAGRGIGPVCFGLISFLFFQWAEITKWLLG